MDPSHLPPPPRLFEEQQTAMSPPLQGQTDYSRWRLEVNHGRHVWHYLRDDEECKRWPQSEEDKYWLGLDVVSIARLNAGFESILARGRAAVQLGSTTPAQRLLTDQPDTNMPSPATRAPQLYPRPRLLSTPRTTVSPSTVVCKAKMDTGQANTVVRSSSFRVSLLACMSQRHLCPRNGASRS